MRGLIRRQLVLLEGLVLSPAVIKKLESVAASGRGMLHFSQIEKLGINPKPSYSGTPYGIYGYALKKSGLSCVFGGARDFSDCEISGYATNYQFVHVAEVKPEAWNKMLFIRDDRTSMAKGTFDRALQLLETDFPEEFPSALSTESGLVRMRFYGKALYRIASWLEPDWRRLTFLFLRMGFSGVYDQGTGTIHENEPEQIVVFKKTDLDHVYTGQNRIGKPDARKGGVPTPEEIKKVRVERFWQAVIDSVKIYGFARGNQVGLARETRYHKFPEFSLNTQVYVNISARQEDALSLDFTVDANFNNGVFADPANVMKAEMYYRIRFRAELLDDGKTKIRLTSAVVKEGAELDRVAGFGGLRMRENKELRDALLELVSDVNSDGSEPLVASEVAALIGRLYEKMRSYRWQEDFLSVLQGLADTAGRNGDRSAKIKDKAVDSYKSVMSTIKNF